MKKLFHKSHKENPSDSFHNDFIIFEVVTFAHIANQRIVSATRDLSSQNLSDTKRIYSCSAHRHPDRLRKARSEPAAFQLIPDSGKKDRFNIPLEVSGSFAFEAGPGTFYLTSTGSDITLASRPFTVNGINSKTPVQFITRGPLYTDLRLTSHCPFRCLLASDWNLRRCHDNAEIATADIDGTDLYFFFGSSTVPISIGSPGNLHNASSIHVKELIQRVLPVYADIAGKSWAEVEPAVVQNVAAGLWEFGEIDFRYDTSMGASSFLAPNGTFWLGNMLRKTISQCNCFDLAAFVYTAFKSFGRRVVRPGQEVDIFDITVNKIENFGYIREGTLFGWQNTFMAFCNNPFWTYNPSNKPQNWKAETQDPNRTFFIRHCFTLFTNCRSEQRVIDICHAPNDHNSNSILTAGSVTLNAYLGLRERGSRTLAAANSQVVNITSIRV